MSFLFVKITGAACTGISKDENVLKNELIHIKFRSLLPDVKSSDTMNLLEQNHREVVTYIILCYQSKIDVTKKLTVKNKLFNWFLRL